MELVLTDHPQNVSNAVLSSTPYIFSFGFQVIFWAENYYSLRCLHDAAELHSRRAQPENAMSKGAIMREGMARASNRCWHLGKKPWSAKRFIIEIMKRSGAPNNGRLLHRQNHTSAGHLPANRDNTVAFWKYCSIPSPKTTAKNNSNDFVFQVSQNCIQK